MGKYLIAVATSDGVHVDTPFGEAERFEVYEITKDAYCKLEERTVVQHDEGVLKTDRTQICDHRPMTQSIADVMPVVISVKAVMTV